MFKITNRFPAHCTGLALSVLMSAALAMPAHAAEIWKINLEKSRFSSSTNTLVLERASAASATKDANGNPPGTFLVISGGKVFMAATDTPYAASPSVRTVDYNRWKDMKLVQIGDKVRSTGYCSFRCISGHRDPRLTLTFTTKGVDASRQMGTMLVLNQ